MHSFSRHKKVSRDHRHSFLVQAQVKQWWLIYPQYIRVCSRSSQRVAYSSRARHNIAFTVTYWQLVLPGGKTSQLTNCALTAHADHAQTHQQRKPSCTIDINVGINTGPTSTFLTDVLLSDQLAKHWLMDNVPVFKNTLGGDEVRYRPMVSPL